MYFDLMQIPMEKIYETKDFVCYKIEIKVKRDTQGKAISHFGIFKFKKEPFFWLKDNFAEYIDFVKEQTDSILFDKKNEILAKCLVRMKACLENNFFPDQEIYSAG